MIENQNKGNQYLSANDNVSIFPSHEENEIYEHLNNTFKLVHDGVRKFGVKKFNKALLSVIVTDNLEVNKNIDKIELIIQCVLDEFKPFEIKRSDIFEAKRRGTVTEARKMVILIIKNNLDISDYSIGSFFGGRCRQAIYKVVSEYTKLDAQNKLDKKFIDRYNNIENKIKEKLKSFSNS